MSRVVKVKSGQSPDYIYSGKFHTISIFRKFTMERQVFNDTVRVFQPLSIDMILCGNFNLNMENNIVLFRASKDIYMLLSVLKPVDSLLEVFLETYFFLY